MPRSAKNKVVRAQRLWRDIAAELDDAMLGIAQDAVFVEGVERRMLIGSKLPHRQRVVLQIAVSRVKDGAAGTYAQELLDLGVIAQSWVYKTLRKMTAAGLLARR